MATVKVKDGVIWKYILAIRGAKGEQGEPGATLTAMYIQPSGSISNLSAHTTNLSFDGVNFKAEL